MGDAGQYEAPPELPGCVCGETREPKQLVSSVAAIPLVVLSHVHMVKHNAIQVKFTQQNRRVRMVL
jgi:hypothetical protein